MATGRPLCPQSDLALRPLESHPAPQVAVVAVVVAAAVVAVVVVVVGFAVGLSRERRICVDRFYM